MKLCTQKRSPRRGMSLPEILVVIAIITVLLGLATGVYFRWMSTQAYSNTTSRMQTIDEALQEAWRKVVEDASAVSDAPSPAVIKLAGGDAKRARVIWIKARLMEAFPVSYAEIYNPVVYNPAPLGSPIIPPGRRKYIDTYRRLLQSAGNPAKAADPFTESSACLWMALTSIRRGSAAAGELAPFQADTDGDGIEEFIDAWGIPLAFFRFPTGNDELNGHVHGTGKRSAMFRDPLDPDGTLVSRNWNPGLRQQFERLFHRVSANGQPPSFHVVPVIVSSGIDGQMGLQFPTMAATSAAAEDNIYSFEFRLGKVK